MFISTTAKHRLADYCALPAEALKVEGVWRKVKPAALKLWAYLWYRSAFPNDKNPGKPKLASTLGMTYNSLKMHWESLVDLDLLVEHEQAVEVVVPGRPLQERTAEQPKATAEQPTAKKEEEEASPEQPQQPLTAKKTPRPVKKSQGGVPAATPPRQPLC